MNKNQITSLIHKAIGISALMASAFFFNYLVNLLLAKNLGAHFLGEFAFIKSVTALIATLILFGFNMGLTKFIPKYLANKDYAKVHGFIRFTAYSIIAISVVLLAIDSGVILIFSNHIVNTKPIIHKLLYTFWIIPLFAFSLYLASLQQALRHLCASSFSERIASPLLLTIALATLFFYRHDLTVIQALYLLGATFAVIIIFQLIHLALTIPKKIFQHKAEYHIKKWLRVSFKLLIPNIATRKLYELEIIVLLLFGRYASDVGFFAANLSIVLFLSIIPAAVRMISCPMISELFAKHKMKKLQHVTNVYNSYIMIGCGILLVFLLIFEHSLLHLFGPSFRHSTVALNIMLFGMYISLIFNHGQSLLRYTKHHGLLTKPVMIVTLSSLVMTSVLVHYLDVTGAAIGFALTNITLAIWYSVLAKQKLGIKPLLTI